MPAFRDIPIKRKLTAITMLTSFVALLLACAAILVYEQITFRQTLTREFWIMADMVQENVAPALAFNDQAALETTLQSLSAHRHIVAGAVYDESGKLVAFYQNEDHQAYFELPAVEPEGSRFSPGRLDTFRYIILGGELIGTVYIATDLKEVTERLVRYGLIMALILVLSCGVAYALSLRLQRVVSEPILHLAETASRVATEKNMSLRAEKRGSDELGTLVDRFNEMLDQIEKQDGALIRAKDQLEQRVEERTLELRQEMADRVRTERERDGFFTVTLDMLFVAGLGGEFRRVNPAFSSILGFAEDRLLAMSFADLAHPDDREKTLEEVRKLGRGQPSHDFENRCSCEDGSYRWIVWTLAPVLETGFLYACGRDVTERKKAQEELAEAQEKLLGVSRQAGMAEVATSVLHNVGNVLNSVGVSAEVVAGKVRQFRTGSLRQLAELLREHAADMPAFLADDPRGKALPAYLIKLVEHLNLPQQEIYQELDSLRKNIEHIKEIVTMQQTYARGAALLEPVSVPGLIEDAIRMNEAAFSRHHVKVSREVGELPLLATDRHKVLQILVNLLNNAKHAVNDGGEEKHIIVRATAEGDHAVKIEVIDYGIGIAEENLMRIFQHGFTTKRYGHGFGLHSGAIAAQELGGSLNARSEGPGKGAVFTLTLPHKGGPR